ncbi:ATP-dependent RNA helicase [Mucor velutinosus]|uniref:Protein YAE1 n=1 Tax=Mucor velutinosus TaxID=708070 RepID=A0AAN7D6N2_9FUNG|nr:ATP-dependent RNA helicase [Mucor velutinosus]
MVHSDIEDDVWANSDSEEQVAYERNLAEKEWERLQEDHGNTGYKEGIVEGKEVNMQKGFDRGYAEGLVIGKAVGRLRGMVSCQIIYYRQMLKNEEAAQELDALFDEIDKIEVNHVYSVDYFRDAATYKEDYVAPEAFVQQLEEKVNSTLTRVSEKYHC